jgi:3'-phosphoadenosine 5'-phosphosulfate synthase
LDLHYFNLLQVAAYDTVAKKMAFFEPSRSQDFLFISGTKVCLFYHIYCQGTNASKLENCYLLLTTNLQFNQMRTFAKTGENPPDGFMCPAGWKVLVDYYNSLQTEEAAPAAAATV